MNVITLLMHAELSLHYFPASHLQIIQLKNKEYQKKDAIKNTSQGHLRQYKLVFAKTTHQVANVWCFF